MNLVSQLTYRVGQSRLHSRPCCSALIRRFSVTILSVWTTRLPKCVVRCAKRPPDVERRVLVNQAASASDSPPRVTVLSWSCGGNSHTRCGAWGRYRPMRFKRVRLAGVAFPSGRGRCQACAPRLLPALMARSDWLSPFWGPILRGRVARWALRRLGSSVHAPPEGPALTLPGSACRGRCRVHVPTWLSAQAGVRATNCGGGNKNCETADSHTDKRSPLDQLNLPTGRQPREPSEVATTSCDDDVAIVHYRGHVSGFVPECTRTILVLSRPMLARTFCTKLATGCC